MKGAKELARACMAEAIGTSILVFLGVGSVQTAVLAPIVGAVIGVGCHEAFARWRAPAGEKENA
jgi:glycerol uptake facilitator-like aquaporin